MPRAECLHPKTPHAHTSPSSHYHAVLQMKAFVPYMARKYDFDYE